jgi:hypothetical protein
MTYIAALISPLFSLRLGGPLAAWVANEPAVQILSSDFKDTYSPLLPVSAHC